MYLHAGNNKSIRLKSIIGIFDMDSSTESDKTRNFLRAIEKDGNTEALFEEIPKSFILTEENKIYFSQISVSALIGRI